VGAQLEALRAAAADCAALVDALPQLERAVAADGVELSLLDQQVHSLHTALESATAELQQLRVRARCAMQRTDKMRQTAMAHSCSG
jgi:hypothetical protein